MLKSLFKSTFRAALSTVFSVSEGKNIGTQTLLWEEGSALLWEEGSEILWHK